MSTDPKNQQRAQLREVYNKTAHERENSGMQDWKIRERANFLAALQAAQKTTLLEIGAGTGRDSKFFQDHGIQPVCIDLSPAMVALCQQKGLTAYVMDVAEMQFPEASFDAVYAINSLLHLPKAELPGILRQIDRLLKPDGLFFFGVYGGIEQEGIWDEDAFEPKRFFSFFTDEHIQQEVAAVFDILSFNRVRSGHDGKLHFQALTLQKRSSTTHPSQA